MTFLQQAPVLTNTYESDLLLQHFLMRVLPKEMFESIRTHLAQMGHRAAHQWWPLCLENRTTQPVHTPYNAWGERIDHISRTPSWDVFARVATEEGLVATAYERTYGAYSRLYQYALVYLFDRSSQVYTCPLAMTDGCARTLETLASEELKSRYFQKLISRNPHEAITSGQWMTERTGGSDVGLTETSAHWDGHVWRLNGVKWFTSAINTDIALTLARPEGNPQGGKGLALFLVQLRNQHNTLQGIQVLRLKEKLGTRHVPTAELQLTQTPATPICGLKEGIKNMGAMLNITRTWNAVCSVASMQRGVAHARSYAHVRKAFSNTLSNKPLHVHTLATQSAEASAWFMLTFTSVYLLGQQETSCITETDTHALSVLQPLCKLATAKSAVASASETLEHFGGAGYVEDTGLPELLRDAQVLPIWEGTTNVLSLEVLRALKRPDAASSFFNFIVQPLKNIQHPSLLPLCAYIQQSTHTLSTFFHTHFNDVVLESHARLFALSLARTTALSCLAVQAQWDCTHTQSKASLHAACVFAQTPLVQLPSQPLPIHALMEVAFPQTNPPRAHASAQQTLSAAG